ncbi:hypothetical protein EHS25_009854 [Saitozyma podzolica]|uniref:Uncharacterized protein n=1 Tax=Saitozyma podzolica TaxID=1890683 RepID=A0A427YKD9_9TREE|nr:hypothetical protein EHS25_009854 [Saitozyma podzolica]
MTDAPRHGRYENLALSEAEHFLEHGWLKVPNTIEPEYITSWMSDLWVRLGFDPEDKSTWTSEYYHMPHHRQVRAELVAPRAWGKIVDICGGEQRIDPERERWIGDNFIINFGTQERAQSDPTDDVPLHDKEGFHCDNDWYRMFLDSSSTALTLVYCFTDIPPRGGGTILCEDGIEGVVKHLYDHPEGLDPPHELEDLCTHVKTCKRFTTVEAKKGDVFILHGLLPHSNNYNYLHYARVITNPHVNLREPYNLNRPDGDYSLLEQVILRNLGRDSIPEFKPTRERKFWYSRNITFKLNRVEGELERMIAAAKARGLGPKDVDSLYLRGEEAVEEFKRTNGLLLPVNEATGLHTEQHPA